jgi:4-hydroxythreonine-4-phosphate dehydrogenase
LFAISSSHELGSKGYRDMAGRIGISLGDVTGIGPEVALKALAAELPLSAGRYLLIGSAEHAAGLDRRLRLRLPLAIGAAVTRTGAGGGGNSFQDSDERILIYNPPGERVQEGLPHGAAAAAQAAVTWVRAGAELCLRGELDALVTAPVNKEAIVRAGLSFVGQTELLSQLADTERTAMMLLGEDDRGRWLRVALATTHVPLKAVSEGLSVEGLENVITLAIQACYDLGLSRARVGVCGLNPHAGEGGHIGTEELTIIGPAVKAARQRGLDVTGPISADSLFYHAYRGDYDGVVAMYHDQGLAPLKMVAFERGVNWTLGLPFIRTSPDHGTAYDIAGQNRANSSSMRAAIQLARRLAQKKAATKGDR